MTKEHIIKRYDGELNHLHDLVLGMGKAVTAQLTNALEAFKNRNVTLANQVVMRDSDIDQMEVNTDVEINKILALRCPVSEDLRFVIAVSKSVSELERIGDEAVRVAGIVIRLFGNEATDLNHYNNQMMRDVLRMGDMALDSLNCAVGLFAVWDEEKALRVMANRVEMEQEFQSDLRRMLTYVIEDTRTIGLFVHLALANKSLGLIGHHAHNLAEYVMYQTSGLDVRHQQPDNILHDVSI